jgi:phage terminase large subunit GpA-like protein
MSATLSARCVSFFTRSIRAFTMPAPRELIWQWLDKHVHVPAIVGSRSPGPLDTGLMPQWRGLLEKYADRRVHFFTLCKAARIGGTLFFGICLVLEKVARAPGPIIWLDPTRRTAIRVSRQEIEPYLQKCGPVFALARLGKTTWTVLEKMFRNCTFSLLGCGSINDLGGRQGELIILNEQDRIPNRAADAPTPSQEAEARSSQFEDTRKLVRNSTPFRESGLTWGEFLAGSQHYCYVPCPDCGVKQRLTMFKLPAEPDAWLRMDQEPTPEERKLHSKVKPAADGRGWLCKGIPATGRLWWPPEIKDRRSNRWRIDDIPAATRYECAHCQAKIRPELIEWMNDRYEWRAHNIFAPRDHVSAHISALYSPWQSWGSIAKQWLLAQGVIAKLHAFFNLVLGLPFTSAPTKLTPKHLELLQSHSPRFERQFPEHVENELTLPARPVCVTMHVDVQQTEFWYTVRCWMPDGARYVLAWGSCGSFADLVALSNRVWRYDHGEASPAAARFEEFTMLFGIIDTGYKAKRQGGVYEFLHDQGGRWQGVRGGAFALGKDKPITEETTTFNYKGQGAVDVPVIKVNDFIMREHLYTFVIKQRRPPGYYLPIALDEHFITQITSEHLIKRKLPDGRTEDVWTTTVDPHLGDCEKYAECLGHVIEPSVLLKLRGVQDDHRARLLVKLAA